MDAAEVERDCNTCAWHVQEFPPSTGGMRSERVSTGFTQGADSVRVRMWFEPDCVSCLNAPPEGEALPHWQPIDNIKEATS